MKPIDDPEFLITTPDLLASPDATSALLCLQIADTAYAVPLECVRETRPLERIVRIPDSPPFVEGVIELRGDIVPVVDLCSRLGARPPGPDARLVVVVIDQRDVALLVDAVRRSIHPEPASLRPTPPFHTHLPRPFIRGLVHEEEEELILMLDLPALLADICPALVGEPDLPALGLGPATARR